MKARNITPSERDAQQRLAHLHKHHAQQAAQGAQTAPETTIKIIMPSGSVGQLQGDALQGYRISPADLEAE
ncbi:hypothetical protein ACN99C_26735 (plasmid) [Pseudomonas alloputida]|uniref:hypothetical protein n=1 Tax=Pseudomonas alloputida TaxID=1940621 RepID=UPI003B429678